MLKFIKSFFKDHFAFGFKRFDDSAKLASHENQVDNFSKLSKYKNIIYNT